MSDSFGIYVIECEGGKYYVGKSVDARGSIAAHKETGGGCEWTKQHKALRGEVATTVEGSEQSSLVENNLTLKYMAKYGVDNVRGGSWSQPDLTDEVRTEIEKQMGGSPTDDDTASSTSAVATATTTTATTANTISATEAVKVEEDATNAEPNVRTSTTASSDKKSQPAQPAQPAAQAATTAPTATTAATATTNAASAGASGTRKRAASGPAAPLGGAARPAKKKKKEKPSHCKRCSFGKHVIRHDCSRCGRDGHGDEDCYASYTIDGDYLEEGW